ncbi:MAG: hypothetical protein A3K10_16410 [Bacteroidetes bacterium RIFCSPLOWO2_12_FULL_31_6]|nr:MAG: hypothetical protein A3K10_16410 [Bacteroidetes bacterium RIFCSPLOWO2_12_FULL_31_6]
MKARRPLECVCFFSTYLPTKEERTYVFLSLDVFSDFVFNTGVETNDDVANIFKHIYLLTEHPNFKKYIDRGFMLVMDKHKELAPNINTIIEPLNGKLIFDGQYVNKIMTPVIKEVLRKLPNQ